jgi:hypothetical protein
MLALRQLRRAARRAAGLPMAAARPNGARARERAQADPARRVGAGSNAVTIEIEAIIRR